MRALPRPAQSAGTENLTKHERGAGGGGGGWGVGRELKILPEAWEGGLGGWGGGGED